MNSPLRIAWLGAFDRTFQRGRQFLRQTARGARFRCINAGSADKVVISIGRRQCPSAEQLKTIGSGGGASSRLRKVVVPPIDPSSRWRPAPSSGGSRQPSLPLVREIVRDGDALVRTRRPLLGRRLAKPADPVLGIWMRRQQARQPDTDRPRERAGRDPLLRHPDY